MQYNFDKIIDRRGTNSVKWDEVKDPEMLPLWVADMDFSTAPCVQEAIVNRATHGCYGYVHVPESYYQAIQDWFATRHQWNIERDSILYTIGVVPAIAAILKAHCQVGDNVVMLTPIYNCFFNLVRNAGCQAICVALKENPDGKVIRYSIDWEKLEEALALEKSTVLLFCNPHNPTGHLWSEEELLRVAELCQKYGILLISDEIHNELTPPDRLYVPVGRVLSSQLTTHNPQLTTHNPQLKYVICTSPSKSFNIAGLQNANIICPDPELRRRIDRAINLNETCDVNPFGVVALEAAYREGGDWLDELRAYIYGNYKFACQRLAEHHELIAAEMESTYFLWLDCRSLCARLGINSAELVARLRIDAHVWFCAGSIYGSDGEGFLRINLACPRATLEEALNRFSNYIKANAQ